MIAPIYTLPGVTITAVTWASNNMAISITAVIWASNNMAISITGDIRPGPWTLTSPVVTSGKGVLGTGRKLDKHFLKCFQEILTNIRCSEKKKNPLNIFCY